MVTSSKTIGGLEMVDDIIDIVITIQKKTKYFYQI